MARSFAKASSEKITLALGAGASVNGAITLAAIVRTASDGGSSRVVVSLGSAAATGRFIGVMNTNTVALRTNNAARNSTTTLLTADGWAFIAATKAAGTATPRFHIYKYLTDTWVHENGGGTLTDSTPTTSSLIGVSTAASANPYDGDIAICGAYASDMTDAQVESMAYDLNAWWQVQPNGLWILDQSATTTLVNDLSGGGAGQTAITGTTVATSSVPTFSYGAPTVGVDDFTPPPQTLDLSPATITVTPVVLTVSTGAVSLLLPRPLITVTAVALTVTAGAVSVALSPATITVTAVALGISVGGAPQTLALTAATITLTPVALGITVLIADPNALTLTLYTTGGTLTLAAVGHTLTDAGWPQPLTIDDEGHTDTLRDWGHTLTAKE